MSEGKQTAWAGDHAFQDSTITRVEAQENGWSITKADGWSFWVPGDSPVAPTVGMTVRMYGRGIGSVVRGLFLDGQCVFYRTEAEQEQHFADEMYGKDAADMVSRWDAGRTIWSVERGGFGPGYEQALQIAMVEFLRKQVSGSDVDDDTMQAILSPLGLSGAQWGAAKGLARQFFANGPQAVLKGVDDSRKIQVSRHYPTLEPAPRAFPALVGALQTALVAMRLAAAMPGVSAEYDFEPAIAEVSAALAAASTDGGQ